MLARLERAGVPPGRVDLLPLAPANADHLGTYAGMDVSLDPFPYAGTTTTCESLYMGVPCVTLAGALPGSAARAWLAGRVSRPSSPVLLLERCVSVVASAPRIAALHEEVFVASGRCFV